MNNVIFCIVIALVLVIFMPVTGCEEKLTLTAEEYNVRAASLANQGKYEDAVKDFTRAIGLEPDNPWFYINRGITYISMKKYDPAISDFDKAIELDPDNAVAYAHRGTAYVNKGEFHTNTAIANFNMVLKLSKDAELIAYAKSKLKEIAGASTPPVEAPPVVGMVPVVTSPDFGGGQTTTSGAIEGLAGLWDCTFEVNERIEYEGDPREGEYWHWSGVNTFTIKGSFSFSFLVRQDNYWTHAGIWGEGAGDNREWRSCSTCSGELLYDAHDRDIVKEKGNSRFNDFPMYVELGLSSLIENDRLSPDWPKIRVRLLFPEHANITITESWSTGDESVEVRELHLPYYYDDTWFYFYMILKEGTAAWEETWGEDWEVGEFQNDWMYWQGAASQSQTVTGKRTIKVVLSHQDELGPNGKNYLEVFNSY